MARYSRSLIPGNDHQVVRYKGSDVSDVVIGTKFYDADAASKAAVLAHQELTTKLKEPALPREVD